METMETLRSDLKQAKVRIEELEEQIATMQKWLVPRILFPQQWRLTPQEGKVLRILLRSPDAPVSRDQFLDVLYATESDVADGPIVSVLVSRIRKKLGALGVNVYCVHSQGYYVTKEDADKLKRMIETHRLEFFD